MRRKDISGWTRGSSSSLEHVAILYSSFQYWFRVEPSLKNTFVFCLFAFFFACCIHILSKITLASSAILVCECRDLMYLNEMGIFLLFSTLFVWEITPGVLIELQNSSFFRPCKQDATHKSAGTRVTHAHDLLTIICSSQTILYLCLQQFFHYSAPWWHILCICIVTLHHSHPSLIQTLNL